MAKFTATPFNTVEIEDSCGCILCDLGSEPEMRDGRPMHLNRNCLAMHCTRDESETAKAVH
jgi:hypothetical protein